MGVGTALYTFGVLLEGLIEGHLRQQLERRRMDRQIGQMTGHFIICGWGRVGRASVLYLDALGKQVVVIDRDPARLQGVDYPTLVGDVTDDSILEAAGIGHARLASSTSSSVRGTRAVPLTITLQPSSKVLPSASNNT